MNVSRRLGPFADKHCELRLAHFTPGYCQHHFGEVILRGMQAEAVDADTRVNLKINIEKAKKGGVVTFKTTEGKTISVKVPIILMPIVVLFELQK